MNLRCEEIARAALGEPAKRQGAELLWKCPRHSDAHPSLQVNVKKNVWLCGPCGASGNAWQLAAFIAGASPDDKRAVKAWLGERGLLHGNEHGGGGGAKVVATYCYEDQDGAVYGRKHRWEPGRNGKKKSFTLERPDGSGGWIPNWDGVKPLPYRLPDVVSARCVLVCEGEKDVETACRLGFKATTSGAVGTWKPELAEYLRGKRVAVIADADEPGRKDARAKARSLIGVAESVRLLEMPGAKDLTAWAEHGGTREQLKKLLKAAPVLTAAEVADVAEQEASEPIGVLASEIKPQPVRWLWTNRIPLGKVTVIDGDPDLGKSLLGLEIAARVSRGEALPGDEAGLSGGAVILSAEDGLEDTIRPRLEAAGAELNRVVIVKYAPDKEGERTVCQIPRDIPGIEEANKRVAGKLVVMDVLMAYLGSETNSYRDQDVRLALAPLASLATRSQVAVVVIRHLNKTGGGNPLYRGGGSIGVIGAARAGMLVAADPEDTDLRLLAMTKSNLGRRAPTLAYRIEERAGVPRIAWQGESQHTAATLLATVSGGEGGALADARDFLLAELEGGPKAARDIERAAKDAGIAKATLRRASKSVRVIPTKDGFQGQWLWSLPSKGVKRTKDAHVQEMSTFGEDRAIGEQLSQGDSSTSPKVLKGDQPDDREGVLSTFGTGGADLAELEI